MPTSLVHGASSLFQLLLEEICQQLLISLFSTHFPFLLLFGLRLFLLFLLFDHHFHVGHQLLPQCLIHVLRVAGCHLPQLRVVSPEVYRVNLFAWSMRGHIPRFIHERIGSRVQRVQERIQSYARVVLTEECLDVG